MSSQHTNIHYGRGSNANTIHFYQVIQPHELQEEELKIRRSFVERYWKGGVSNPISLKLPNGSEWKMFWEKRGEDIWLLKKNWKSFARSLRSGDQLVFKYKKGESDFDVIIFDDSALEIDYSSIRSYNNAADDDDEEEESDNDDNDDDDDEIVNESQKPSQQPVKEEEIKSCEKHESSSNPHLETKRKINVMMDSHATHQNLPRVNNSNSNSGGTVKKKAKKCSTTDENPNFTIKLSRTYAQGNKLRIPCWFSKEYLNELEGTTATINCVREERTWKVKLKLHDIDGSFRINAGWKSFAQEHNLQVDDVCKFEMTQCKPVAFIITITRAKDEPHHGLFQGSEQESNQQHQDKLEKLAVDKSRSCKKAHGSEHESNQLHQDKLEKLALDKPGSCKKIHGSADSDKQNKFLVYVSSLLKLSVPMEFIKRYNICNGNSIELKVGEQSWLVKVRYFPQLDFWRFSEGWLEFVSGSNLKIGDNCQFEMIDEENLVFKVSIVLDV